MAEPKQLDLPGFAGFKGPKTYLYRIAVAKVAKQIVKFAFALLAAHGLDKQLDNWGVTVDWAGFETTLAGAILAAMEFTRNYLKNKKKLKWAQWL